MCYTAAQWKAPGTEIVSCDASGDKYVLAKPVVLASQVTYATAQHLHSTGQWIVHVTLNSAATAAFAQLTTTQATLYYPASSHQLERRDAGLHRLRHQRRRPVRSGH